MTTWQVHIYERYADGHEWTWHGDWQATRPDIALRQALAWNRRSGPLTGHGRMAAITASVDRQS